MHRCSWGHRLAFAVKLADDAEVTDAATDQASVPCALCGMPGLTLRGDVRGYLQGSNYKVWECPSCQSQSAVGLPPFANLYDAIYACGQRLEGYSRYYRFAHLVKTSRQPLARLSRCEDVYWAVSEVIRRQAARTPLRVVEVASGLGYLTAALRIAGMEAYGVDISGVAVKRATDTFGPWYSVADAFSPDEWQVVEPDVIVALELIEHVADPVALIEKLTAKLPAHGQLVLSTPNRTVFPSAAVWQSDLPPVHLHWISEAGLAAAAFRANCSIEFIDFSRYNRWARSTENESRPSRVMSSLLAADLQPINPCNRVREWLLSSTVAPLLLALNHRMSGAIPASRQQSGSLVALIARSSGTR